MIPKIIHYCWFGGNPLPESALKCINSWRKFFPDYEIKEWNEQNFDVNIIPYTAEAYQAKQYAFVSDYARFWILYHHGGLYFDTDVEVIKPMDDIIARGPFMGREAGAYIKSLCPTFVGEGLAVAPGLGIGVYPKHELYEELLSAYNGVPFYLPDGSLNTTTIVSYTTKLLVDHGLSNNNNKPERVFNVWIYPAEYFCPIDHTHCNKLEITQRTVSIHHYDCSWIDHNSMSYHLHNLKIWLSKRFGERLIVRISDIIKRR